VWSGGERREMRAWAPRWAAVRAGGARARLRR
jgi:hypothetical protein